MSFVDSLKELGLELEGKPLTLAERKTIYASAYGMYEVGDYTHAAQLFTQLILNEPHAVDYWKGLAASRQMLKEYQAALHAWSIVCLLGGHQSISHFHAAECYLSMGELKEADKALECAQFHLKENSGILSHRIEELKKVVSNA